MTYYVDILTNKRHTVFYTGMTNSLEQRIFEHKIKINKGFTSKYNCHKLVYFEEYPAVWDAIHREKQLKKYLRKWKMELITGMNPSWKDLSEGWYDETELKHLPSKL
jgi:putative endonuclease